MSKRQGNAGAAIAGFGAIPHKGVRAVGYKLRVPCFGKRGGLFLAAAYIGGVKVAQPFGNVVKVGHPDAISIKTGVNAPLGGDVIVLHF